MDDWSIIVSSQNIILPGMLVLLHNPGTWRGSSENQEFEPQLHTQWTQVEISLRNIRLVSKQAHRHERVCVCVFLFFSKYKCPALTITQKSRQLLLGVMSCFSLTQKSHWPLGLFWAVIYKPVMVIISKQKLKKKVWPAVPPSLFLFFFLLLSDQ